MHEFSGRQEERVVMIFLREAGPWGLFCCVKSYISNVPTFTNKKRTDLLVNVRTFLNVSFYTTDPSCCHKVHCRDKSRYNCVLCTETSTEWRPDLCQHVVWRDGHLFTPDVATGHAGEVVTPSIAFQYIRGCGNIWCEETSISSLSHRCQRNKGKHLAGKHLSDGTKGFKPISSHKGR